MSTVDPAEMEARAEEFRQIYTRVKTEIGKVIVGHDEIGPAVRHLGEAFAGVEGPDPDPRPRVQRQFPAHQSDEGGVAFDDLLGGAGAGGGDVPGERASDTA